MSTQAQGNVNDLLTNLKNSYECYKDNIKELNNQLDSTHEKLKHQAEELQLKNEIISKLQKDLDEKDQRIMSLEHEVKDRSNQITCLASTNVELNRKLDHKAFKMDSLCEKLNEMIQLRSDAVSKYEEQKEKCLQLQEHLIELKDKVEELNGEFSCVKKELQFKENAYKEKFASFTATIAQKESENRSMQKQLDRMSRKVTVSEIDVVKNQMEQLQQVFDAKILSLQNENEQYLKELEELKQALEEKKDSIDLLIAEKEGLEARQKDLEDELDELKASHEIEITELKYYYEGNLKEQSSDLLYLREEIDRIAEELNAIMVSNRGEETFQEYEE